MRGRGRAVATAAAALFGAVALPSLHAARSADVADTAGKRWTVQQRPFLVQFTAVAQARSSRMSYVLADGSRHTLGRVLATRALPRGKLYTVATDEPRRRARVAITQTDLGVNVDWRLEPDEDVVEVHEAFAAPGEQHFLGTGQRHGYVDLLGRIVPLKVSFDCDSTLVAPYFASSAGYAIRVAGSATGQIQFKGSNAKQECQGELWRPLCQLAPAPREVRLCIRGSSLAYEVYTGGFSSSLARFTARTGRPRPPARSQFALIKWRDSISTSAELLDDIEQLQRRRIPVGWVLLDNPWEESCFGTLDWDRRRTPDPAATIAEVHRRGVRFMLWVSPYVRCPPAGYAAEELVGRSGTRTIDLTNDAARIRFESRLRRVFELGVDGVKGDRGDEHDLEGKQFAGGSGAELHNWYPSLFAQSVLDVLRDVRGDDAGAMFRAGWSGVQRTVPGFWGGDQDGTFTGLAAAIRGAQTAGASGFPVWGSDVGGYRSERLTPTVFVRWAQLGAISPILEVGGRGAHSQFWKWGEPTISAFRRAVVLHYELFPYLYELARRASRTGSPILRPLGWSYPRDPDAWKRDLQLMLGPDLLAAPVTSPNPLRRVYLPAGSWIDLWRGTRVHGPRTVTRRTPLAELPLYLRSGSAIPFDFRTPEVWTRKWDINDLGRSGRAGWVVAPGERKTVARAGRSGTLRAKVDGDRVEVSLQQAPREVQVLVADRRRPRALVLGGRAVSEAPSVAALRFRRSGWIHVTRPVVGTVVKLGTGAPRTFEIDFR